MQTSGSRPLNPLIFDCTLDDMESIIGGSSLDDLRDILNLDSLNDGDIIFAIIEDSNLDFSQIYDLPPGKTVLAKCISNSSLFKFVNSFIDHYGEWKAVDSL